MTRKRAKPVDQTSFGMPGTTETPRALRSPPMATGEPRRLLSSTPFQSSSGECRVVLFRLDVEGVLEFLEVIGILLRQVVGLTEILIDVVQLPP
jgi:hypothetical protein